MLRLHEHDAVGQDERLIDIVRDEYRRLAARTLPEVEQHVLQTPAYHGIQRAERFVEQHNGRIDGKCPGNGDTLTHTTRKLERIAIGSIANANLFEQGTRSAFGFRLVDALIRLLHREHDVLDSSLPREQRIVLEHDRTIGTRPIDDATVDEHLTMRRHLKAGNEAEHRRLAATGMPHQTHELTV